MCDMYNVGIYMIMLSGIMYIRHLAIHNKQNRVH